MDQDILTTAVETRGRRTKEGDEWRQLGREASFSAEAVSIDHHDARARVMFISPSFLCVCVWVSASSNHHVMMSM